MRVSFPLPIFPLEKRPKRRTAMAVVRLLFRSEFGEGLANLREVEERIIAKAICSARFPQDLTFGSSVKKTYRVPVTRRGDHADEPGGAKLIRYFVQVAKQAGVVGRIIRIAGIFTGIVLVGRITRRTHARRSAQSVNFQPGIVGDYQLAVCGLAIKLRFLPGIGFEGRSVFNNSRQGREARKHFNLHVMSGSSANEVANFTGIRCSYEDTFQSEAPISRGN